MKEVFNMDCNEVTITMDYEEFIGLMKSLTDVANDTIEEDTKNQINDFLNSHCLAETKWIWPDY